MCVVKQEIVVAGRGGMVKDVTIKHDMRIPMDGLLLVSEVDFTVGIQDWLSMRVAAIVDKPTVVESDLGWDY